VAVWLVWLEPIGEPAQNVCAAATQVHNVIVAVLGFALTAGDARLGFYMDSVVIRY